MTVSILGCGWYGKALASALIANGISVKGSVTSTDKLGELSALGIKPYVIKFPGDNQINNKDFSDCDVLIVSIPPKFRKGESGDFISKIENIIAAITAHGIKKVIYTSSTAVYGDEQGTVTEMDAPIPGDESGRLLLQAEQLFQNQPQFSSTILRFGGLVGPGRHPGRFFAGKKDIPNGLAPVNLIHLADAVGIGMAVIEKEAYGQIFNSCSPDHPAKADFYALATQQAGLEQPAFTLQTSSLKIVNSVNLQAVLNYNFKYYNWAGCQF